MLSYTPYSLPLSCHNDFSLLFSQEIINFYYSSKTIRILFNSQKATGWKILSYMYVYDFRSLFVILTQVHWSFKFACGLEFLQETDCFNVLSAALHFICNINL